MNMSEMKLSVRFQTDALSREWYLLHGYMSKYETKRIWEKLQVVGGFIICKTL